MKKFYDKHKMLLQMILAAGICYIVFGVVLGIAVIKGSSMEPNYHEGQIVLFIRSGELHEGDVVILQPDNSGEILIKRIIAVAGDSIEIINGDTYKNGNVFEEAYSIKDSSSQYPLTTIQNGHVFVMGDNRPNSRDSRSDDLGQIQEENILGKVIHLG